MTNKDDKAAKIAAIKARLAKGSAGGADAPAASAATSGGGAAHVVVPDGDKGALIAAIKARVGGGPRVLKEGQDAGAPPPVAGATDGGGAAAGEVAGGGEDMAARVAALKAKMEAGKGASAGAAPASKPAAAANPKKRGAAKSGTLFPVQPISKTSFGDEYLYGPSTLTRWFALSSILLTVACVGMWVRDWDRDWKPWQEIKRNRDIAMIEAEIGAHRERIDADALTAADTAVTDGEAAVEVQRDQLGELQDELTTLEGAQYAAKSAYQIQKSILDTMRYEYEELRIGHGDDDDLLADSTTEFREARDTLTALLGAWETATDAVNDKKAELAQITGTLTAAEKALEALKADLTLAEKRLAKIGPGIFNDYIRNAPLADMLQPTLKIQQYVLEDLKDNYNFMHVGRIDRCTTCHVGIDDPNYVDHDVNALDGLLGNGSDADGSAAPSGEVVLNAHPRLDLYVSDLSPHPASTFGCTTCHWGRGQAVEFGRTFHMPSADVAADGTVLESVTAKRERWVRDFGYQPDRHYWDWPMIPTEYAYSACFQCHDEQERLDGVPEYNRPRELVEDLGCYGCHKIKGLEYLRKVGPDLGRIAAKTDQDWAEKWVLSPRDFRPTTGMPHFWNQSNTGARANVEAFDGQPELVLDLGQDWDNNTDDYVADWRARNQTEAAAIVAYVFDQSRSVIDQGGYGLTSPPNRIGNVDVGRTLFHDRGCLGCHSLETEDWTENDHGPDLSAIGSKVEPTWLFNWILDPQAYFPDSVMPDLRLEPDEAWDITAYLMSRRNEAWEQGPAVQTDEAVLRQIAEEYLVGTRSMERAQAEAMALGPQELELYVGRKLFERNGCAGCHLVPGHEVDMGIGTELTKEAVKELSKFAFTFEASHHHPAPAGHADIEHSTWGWLDAKLTDPRRFDRMPIIKHGADGSYVAEYKQKAKAPGDKLKMPNFYLSDADRHDLVTFLMGMRADGIDESMMRHLDPTEQLVEEGARLISSRNCTGCHKMGNLSTPMVLDEDTIEEGFEWGLWLAHGWEADGEELVAEGEWLSDEFYNPWEEEDYDTLEFLEDTDSVGKYALSVQGRGEGGMGRYIDQPAYRPPFLRRQGEKTQPDWLHEFLLEPYILRTHLEVRMPSFGFTPEESRALVHWFADKDGASWPFYLDEQHGAFDAALFAKGQAEFNLNQCNSCHPAGSELPSNPDKSNWGPDLGLARDRLQSAWVQEWLVDPPEFSPGTKMPSFFGEFWDGEYDSPYEDYEERIESLAHYLKHVGSADAGDT